MLFFSQKGGACMTKEEIGRILKNLRLSCGMTQKEVAEKLGRKQQIIGHWETGYSQPDANTLFILCDIYNTSVDEAFGFTKIPKNISKNLLDILEMYENLDEFGKESVKIVLKRENERVMKIRQQKQYIERLKSEISEELIPSRIITYFHRIASAGSGEYLFDDMPTDLIKVKDTPISRIADFVIGVNGDSMEPDYYDGEKVFVETTSDIGIGEVGIFLRGNECFIKERGRDGLISRNPKYPDIEPYSDGIKIVGKVVGKAVKID